MQIQNYSVNATSYHSSSTQRLREVIVANPNNAADAEKTPSNSQLSASQTTLSLSTAAQSMSSQRISAQESVTDGVETPFAHAARPSGVEQELKDAQDKVEKDPRLQLMRSIIESLTGRKVETIQLGKGNAANEDNNNAAEGNTAEGNSDSAVVGGSSARPPRFFIQTTNTTYIEQEKTKFLSNGFVTLKDGSSIQWNISMDMERYYRQDSSMTVVVDGKKRDPLVINLEGGPVELQGQRMKFDLNGDGQLVDMPMLSGQRGYLALDKNGNGKVDNGQELFGPSTNNGFAELAQYDEDGNGWIDSGDSIFKELKIWFPTMDGSGLLSSLAEFGLAAIQLNATNTPFELRDENNQSLGAIRATGVYLTESGQVGTVQQIDVTV